jgi:hypothetical protein
VARERVGRFEFEGADHVYSPHVVFKRTLIERALARSLFKSLERREEGREVVRVKRTRVVAVVKELGRRKESLALESRDEDRFWSPTIA